MAAHPFPAVGVAVAGQSAVVVVAGVLDRASGTALTDVLRPLCTTDADVRRVVVDVRGLASMDEHGAELLLDHAALAQEHAKRFTVAEGPPAVQAALARTRAGRRLTTVRLAWLRAVPVAPAPGPDG